MISRTISAQAARAALRLLRLPLAAMVGLTALTAARLADPLTPWLQLLPLFWGILLVSTAASVLNQVLECRYDALVPRTMHRPLASAQLAPAAGYRLGLLLALCGAGLLGIYGLLPLLFGLAALFWYLLVYTPLKRLTSLAVLVGTPCGAVPVLIGWLAVGRELPAPQPLALALLLVLWQVPHFWLLALPEQVQLRAAGYRVLPELGERKLLNICHRWLLGLALATLWLPALGMLCGPAAFFTSFAALSLALFSSLLLQRSQFPQQTAVALHRLVSLYLLVVLLTLLFAAGS